MGLRISTNVSSMSANRQLAQTSGERQRTLERLASGERIVRSGDDAAGLSISDKLRAGIRSMQMAQRNAQDGVSMLQTAEGGVTEAQNILLRLRELSVQAASDTIGDVERSFTNNEFQHLKDEIQRIANTTLYDRKPLLNGLGPTLDFQVGIDNKEGLDRLSYTSDVANVTPAALGISGTRIDTKETARQNLPAIDAAISKLGENRAYLGSLQTVLQSQMLNLDQSRSNLARGNSRIRDADFAEWTAKNIKTEIMEEAGRSVVTQADNMSKSAVRLLEKA